MNTATAALITGCLPEAGPWHEDARNITPAPGSYLLCFTLDRDIEPDIRKRTWIFPAGTYIYCGSARGPGGLRARLGRHFRQGKKPHWHIDHLMNAADGTGAFIFPGSNARDSECRLCRALRAHPRIGVPAAGFGSSDCRTCPSHLLRVAPG